MKKNFHQVVKSACYAFLLVFLSLFFSNYATAGTLHFKMTTPKTTLAIGETTTVTVSAWVDDAASGNGLITWQTDLSVDNTGVVGITKTGSVADISLLAPSDRDSTFSGWSSASVNAPITGEVREVVVVQRVLSNPSNVGVGGYTDIFTFNIEALANGTATYTLCDDGGGLFFGTLVNRTEYDNGDIPGSVVFDAGSSNNTFTVIPEPTTLAVFAFAGLWAALRRK
ncbi:MAG: PEP-CTERM sorting domain-containing protein [Sedimentisphaerales bacterium]